MYLAHYGLREPPFSITPDPRFVYLSERHRDALAHLLYGVGQGGGSGFVQLTGEVGTGKTTLSRLLLEQLPEQARVALILHPLLSPIELLEAIGEELHIPLDGRRGNAKALVDALHAFLLEAHAAGLRVVLVVDEAQNLSPAALEQVRLLTNLETATQKLLQIILLGQPELRDQLARPELRQLAQRITARFHLDPLGAEESEAYLRHRWKIAGGTRFPFSGAAMRRLHRRAQGIPRLLNVIAERALLAGYARGETVIGRRLLEQAADEVLAQVRYWPGRLALATACVLCVTALAAFVFGLSVPDWPQHPIRIQRTPQRSSAARHAIAAPVLPASVAAGIILPSAKIEAIAPPIDDEQFASRVASSRNDLPSAWAELIALWSIPPSDIGLMERAPCPMLKGRGLFCASGRQRLSLLAQFDRPALLRLRTHGHGAWAVLLGAGATQALVAFDGETSTVHRSALEDAMTGYAVLGRAPSDMVLPLKPGDTGAGVAWLRAQLLRKEQSQLVPDTTARYDDALTAAVRIAQRDFGLHADGVVGPETLLALLAQTREGPHLRRLPE